jgi:hypothetical protein
MKAKKQSAKESNRIIWQRAGRIARQEGWPLSLCPRAAWNGREPDTYGLWLMEQWRAGWNEEDQRIRQAGLFQEAR